MTVRKLKRLERFEIWQGGAMVACVEGENREATEREAYHYASQYVGDGPVSIRHAARLGCIVCILNSLPVSIRHAAAKAKRKK